MGRIDDLRSGRKGLIRVASSPALIDTLHAKATKYFKIEQPQAEFKFTIATSTREIVEMVASEEVDIGTCQPSSGDASVSAQHLILGQVVCIMPKTHRLSSRSFVTPQALESEDIISYSEIEPSAALIFENFAAAGVTLRSAVEINWTIGACSFVEQGLGLALASSFTNLDKNFPTLCARPIAPEIPVRVHLLTPSIRPISTLSQRFCSKLLEIGSEKSAILRNI